MPHRQLVGTVRPCGTIAQYTGRDAFDLRKSLIWPRGIALSSTTSSTASTATLGKPYHSLHKFQEISKTAGRPSISDAPGAAGPGGESIPIPAKLGAGASTRALRRARSDDVARLLHQVEKKAKEEELPVATFLSRMRCQRLTSAQAPALGDPAAAGSTAVLIPPPSALEPAHHDHDQPPQFASQRQACSTEPPIRPRRNAPARDPPRSQGTRCCAMKPQGDHGLNVKNTAIPQKKAAGPVKKVAVKVSMTMSTTHKTSALAMDDVVVLMVPKEALGSTVIALALAAREFDSEDDMDVVLENPDHFDLLRLRPVTPTSKDRFHIGTGIDRTKPIGDAGTLFFVLSRSRE